MSTFESATSIAAAVRSGERSAADVLAEHVARLDEREAELHAFNHICRDEAAAQAAAIDAAVAAGDDLGPLAGVPVAVKDNICTRGIPTTCSSKILDGWLPPYDATVVKALAAAGAITVGKANLDEFAMGSSTENSATGPSRNPHDPSRVPGGSSGGSAVAVAAGFAAAALGSDTGGSIRLPASYCGLVGAKPTYGRVSRLGLVAFGSSLDQIGPLTHTVADAALVLSVISGHDTGDSTSIPQPPLDLSAALGAGVSGMRIGVVSEMMGEGIDPSVAARVRAAAEALSAAGADVVEVSIPAVKVGLSAYYVVAPAEASSNLARYDGVRYGNRVNAATTGEMMELTRTQGFGEEVKRRIMLGTYALSAGYYDALYGRALKVRALLRSELEAAYEKVDALIGPVAPTTAFEFGAAADDPMTMYLNDICTIIANLVGHPAMSVPYGVGADGMPVGVQISAPAMGEEAMFRVGATLEATGATS